MMFDRYICCDYSGAGAHHVRSKSLVVFEATQTGFGAFVLPPTGKHWSRKLVHDWLMFALDVASARGERVLVGFDFQFSWPAQMWKLAGVAGTWRAAVTELVSGSGGRPPIALPRVFAKRFNDFLGQPFFWSATKAQLYGIPRRAPGWSAMRLTESQPMPTTGFHPKPANRLGDNGSVGGQTLCGLPFLADLAARADVACWPFDGMAISDARYDAKHVVVEIYPSGLRPTEIKQSDRADTMCSAIWLRLQDQAGTLAHVVNVPESHAAVTDVELEGWIVGAGATVIAAWPASLIGSLRLAL